MGKLTLTPEQTRYASIGVLVLAGLLALDALYQIGMHAHWRWWMPATLAAEATASQPADTQPAKAAKKPPKLHAALQKRNIFTKAQPTGHGLTLTGVIGDTALFQTRGNQTVGIKEGKSGNGIEVVSIQAYPIAVTIRYKGKPQTLKLSASGGGGGGPQPSGVPGTTPPSAPSRPPGAAPPPPAGPGAARAAQEQAAKAQQSIRLAPGSGESRTVISR